MEEWGARSGRLKIFDAQKKVLTVIWLKFQTKLQLPAVRRPQFSSDFLAPKQHSSAGLSAWHDTCEKYHAVASTHQIITMHCQPVMSLVVRNKRFCCSFSWWRLLPESNACRKSDDWWITVLHNFGTRQAKTVGHLRLSRTKKMEIKSRIKNKMIILHLLLCQQNPDWFFFSSPPNPNLHIFPKWICIVLFSLHFFYQLSTSSQCGHTLFLFIHLFLNANIWTNWNSHFSRGNLSRQLLQNGQMENRCEFNVHEHRTLGMIPLLCPHLWRNCCVQAVRRTNLLIWFVFSKLVVSNFLVEPANRAWNNVILAEINIETYLASS